MARPTTPSTIILHGEDNSRDRKDGVAQEAITPGELVEVQGTTDTGADTARQLGAQSTAGSRVPTRFALEYSHTGGGIDDDYAADEHCEYRHFKKGEEVYAFLAVDETVDVDDYLVSDGAGALRALDTAGGDDASAAIATAAEAVDATGEADPVRIRAEVI